MKEDKFDAGFDISAVVPKSLGGYIFQVNHTFTIPLFSGIPCYMCFCEYSPLNVLMVWVTAQKHFALWQVEMSVILGGN